MTLGKRESQTCSVFLVSVSDKILRYFESCVDVQHTDAEREIEREGEMIIKYR